MNAETTAAVERLNSYALGITDMQWTQLSLDLRTVLAALQQAQPKPEPRAPGRTDTLTLASAMDVLARDIHCEDGVATAAIQEAAMRLRELHADLADAQAELTRLEMLEIEKQAGG